MATPAPGTSEIVLKHRMACSVTGMCERSDIVAGSPDSGITGCPTACADASLRRGSKPRLELVDPRREPAVAVAVGVPLSILNESTGRFLRQWHSVGSRRVQRGQALSARSNTAPGCVRVSPTHHGGGSLPRYSDPTTWQGGRRVGPLPLVKRARPRVRCECLRSIKGAGQRQASRGGGGTETGGLVHV